MKTTPISEIQAMDRDVDILKVAGRVTKAYKPKSGEGKNGPWTLQGITLQDSTGSISVQVWNHDQVLKVGDNVTFTAYHGDRGWSGIKSDEYEGNPQIKVTKTADISFDGDLPNQQEDAPQTKKQARQPAPSLPPVSIDDILAKGNNALYKIKKALINQWDQASLNKVGAEYVDPTMHVQFQKEFDCLWWLLKERGLVDEMPVEPVWRKE